MTTTHPSVTRAGIALALVVLLAVLAPPARAATGRGTFELRRAGNGPSAHARWGLGGSVVTASAEAPRVGVDGNGLILDTDQRYVHATLTAAHQDREVTDCGDGLGNTVTQSMDGVAHGSSAFQTDLELNLLHGRGTAQLGVAEAPWSGANGNAFAPGRTFYDQHATCYGSVTGQHAPVDVVGDNGTTMFSAFASGRLYEHAWRLRRGRDGAWRLTGTHRWSDGFAHFAAAATVTFRGSGHALHARCVIPTIRDLAGAHTVRAARSILRRAGFPDAATGAKHTRAARKGRFYVVSGREEIGGTSTACGLRGRFRLHLVRSLGP